MHEEEKSTVDRLIAHTEEYFKTRQELSKLVAAEKTSTISSAVISSLIIFMIFFFVIVFVSIALAYALAMYFGATVYGFLTVAGLYLLAGIMLLTNKKKWIEIPFANLMIKNFFKDPDND